MKRCVDSGLWVPDAGVKLAEGKESTDATEASVTSDDEDIYHEAFDVATKLTSSATVTSTDDVD